MQLIAQNISKSFGATLALDNVATTLESGKVRALVGENGAGKSTLFKVIAGNVQKDSGSMLIDGQPYDPVDMAHAEKMGVAMVFQEITISTSLGIAENIFIDRMRNFTNKFGLLDARLMRDSAQRLLDEIGAGISVSQDLHRLDLGQWKIIEVARALSYNPKVLLLDESTAYLNTQEVNALLNVIARLKERGMAIGFVSHHLNEVSKVADMITILKDGKWVGDYHVSELSTDEIEALMVGREIGRDIYPYQGRPEIKGVWCANGATASGVLAAIRDMGMQPGKDIFVVGMDLNPGNIEAMKRGELAFDIGGHWMQGGLALVMMFDALNGYPIDPTQRNIKLKLRPLTRERIPEYEKDFPDGFPLYDFKQHSRVFNLGSAPAYTEFILASTPHMSASSRRFKIGAVVPTLETEFWRRYYEFMQKGADELGIELIKRSADNIPERLETIVRDLLAQKVDGLIAVPYWGYDKTILNLTKKSGTPLIFTDVYSDEVAPGDPEYPNYLAFIGPTDEEAGYLMAKALFAVTPADETGKKHIGCVEGTPGTTVARDRSKGLERALREHSEVVVSGRVNGDFILSRSQTSFEKLTRVVRPVGEPVLEMLDISVEGKITDITLSLHRGEILGMGGLKGSGGEAILEVLYGEYPPTKGEMRYEGKVYHPRRPDQAWEMGIAYLPGSRTTEGLIVDFSVLWNLSMASIPQKGPFIDLSSERALGERLVAELRIKAPSVTVSCNSLSGGNLQKVVLGKCMAPNPKVLLLNNPTRGIDVGARMEIYRIIHQLAQNGISVILLSEDLPELIGMSDRIVITRAGRISKTFERGEHPTEEEIISYMI